MLSARQEMSQTPDEIKHEETKKKLREEFDKLDPETRADVLNAFREVAADLKDPESQASKGLRFGAAAISSLRLEYELRRRKLERNREKYNGVNDQNTGKRAAL